MTTSSPRGPDGPAPDGADASETSDSQEGSGGLVRRRVGLFLGVAIAVAIYFLLPDSLSGDGKRTASVATLMAVWWMTEAIPIPATALVPLVLFPVLTGAAITDVAAPYASEIIFLFMGGFMLAMAMQRWNLHRRIALSVVAGVGGRPVTMILGFMLATAFITMWVSNTATAVMMMPIALSVLTLVARLNNGKADPNFGVALMLGVGYAASIGSVATLIGTPPNAIMVGYLSDNHGIDIGFGQWMVVGVPLAALFLLIAWVVLAFLIYPPGIRELPGGRELVRGQLREMGPMSRGEWTVLVVFVMAALSWVTIPLLANVYPWLERIDDAGIAMAVAVVLFLIPVDARNGVPALDWESAVQLPWGVLLLFGGGLSLSAQFGETGLSDWIGEQVGLLGGVPAWVLILVVAAMVLLLTELTSNTATANIFIPVMAGVALGLGLDVMTLVVPAALAASMAFMLPVATPPNAIVFGTGHIRIGQMVKAGGVLNIIAAALILVVMYSLAGVAFGI